MLDCLNSHTHSVMFRVQAVHVYRHTTVVVLILRKGTVSLIIDCIPSIMRHRLPGEVYARVRKKKSRQFYIKLFPNI